MRPVENRIPAMGTRGRTMFSARGQSPRMTWSSRLGIEGREGEPERLKIPRKIRTRAIAAATLPLVMAAVITAAWLVMVQPAWAQAPDDVNDDGRPYVWVQDWKLPGSVPHDVTEGDDMTFTVIRDGPDLSGPSHHDAPLGEEAQQPRDPQHDRVQLYGQPQAGQHNDPGGPDPDDRELVDPRRRRVGTGHLALCLHPLQAHRLPVPRGPVRCRPELHQLADPG